MHREIKLTKGKVVLIDEEDYLLVSKYRWHISTNGKNSYARCIFTYKEGPYKAMFMHRLILNLLDKPWVLVDHINGNGLDNRKENLRPCNTSLNSVNKKKKGNTTSRYKGVCWNKQAKKWMTTIRVEGKKKTLGYFDNEIEAAKMYDKWASSLFSQFAVLNFP